MLLAICIIEFILIIPFAVFVNDDIVASIFVLVNFFTILILIKQQYPKFATIIIIGYILRLLLLVLDAEYNILKIYSPDSVGYHNKAMYIVETNISLDNYPIFISWIYKIIRSDFIDIAQYINVLFGLGTIVCMAKICNILNLSRKKTIITLCFVAFAPFSIIFDSSLLREAFVKFFVALSMLYCIKWISTSNRMFFIFALISVLISSIMHSGVIFIILGLIILYSMYNKKYRTFEKISLKGIVLISILGFVLITMISSTDIFTSKIDSLSDDASFENKVMGYMREAQDAGSAYLKWLPKNMSTTQMLMYSPLKIIYFLFSPLFTEWRGLNDIFAFCVDSIIYIYILFVLLKNFNITKYSKRFNLYILTGLFISIFAFAMAASTAGTAMRHRGKLFPVMLTMFIVTASEKEKTKKLYFRPK